ncbi:MAG: hypothetical protein MJE66_22830 [Proteobacteria bacterium]|nr:hypothetical protein [Pseudomonadota bacterium]
MAYVHRRSDGRFEIRESLHTPRGPRARTLATFRDVLTADVLDHAAARATRAFDRAAVLARAVERGIRVSARRSSAPARALLAQLRRERSLDPVWVTLLREALASCAATPVPEERAEVAEWVGVGERRRGEALRGLLRTHDRIVRDRPARRMREAEPFPRFSSLDPTLADA